MMRCSLDCRQQALRVETGHEGRADAEQQAHARLGLRRRVVERGRHQRAHTRPKSEALEHERAELPEPLLRHGFAADALGCPVVPEVYIASPWDGLPTAPPGARRWPASPRRRGCLPDGFVASGPSR